MDPIVPVLGRSPTLDWARSLSMIDTWALAGFYGAAIDANALLIDAIAAPSESTC